VTDAPLATKAGDMNASASAAPVATLTRRQVNDDLAVLNIATSPSECRERTREKNLPLPSGSHFFGGCQRNLARSATCGHDATAMPDSNSRRDYDASIARPRYFTSRICPDKIVTLR